MDADERRARRSPPPSHYALVIPEQYGHSGLGQPSPSLCLELAPGCGCSGGGQLMEEVDAEVGKQESPVTRPNTFTCATGQLATAWGGRALFREHSWCEDVGLPAAGHISCIGHMSCNRQLCMIIAHVMLPGDAGEEDMNVK